MGVDARMVVKLMSPISDDQLIDASYRLAEACGQYETFFLSNDDDLARGEVRRALNRIVSDDDYECCGVACGDGSWLSVSLWGRYYGVGYERGNLWSYIAIAEWLEREFAGCAVFYGGDTGRELRLFSSVEREALIAHWARSGGRPYYSRDGHPSGRWLESSAVGMRPLCPLCQRPATQYGSGGQFASWTCDACSRHWVWVGGEQVKGFPPSTGFDAFKAAKEMRGE